MLDGLETTSVDTGEVSVNLCHGGDGPPLLLLHGYPQTHFMWRRVVPTLARRFHVVCPDLRGYGDSDKPPGSSDRATYSKRTMAQDQLQVMRSLGFERFALAGHDRGARVSLRMALDNPDVVERLAVLDIIPTRTIYETLDQGRATTVWRYFLLIQPDGLPERLIGSNREWYLHRTLDEWCGTPGALDADAVAEYERCFDEASVHATCADYRAGATVDLVHDRADAGRRLDCPLLALWSETGIGRSYDVDGIWREYSGDFVGQALACGHFLAEERPKETADALCSFFSGVAGT